jgi:glucose 1-dehydrogenase
MRILLTGASRGIGRAIAERLARPGARLALCASAPSTELDETVAVARKAGAEVHGLSADLSDPASPAALVEQAFGALGGIDAVVSNAGIAKPGLLAEMAEDDWNRIFSVNVRSPWLLARAAHKHLIATKGAFIAVASMSGVEPYAGVGAYSPSKAALIMLVRQLALEWAEDGARVNAVSPGLFLSAMTAPIYADAEKRMAREALVPMRRIGDPVHDIAGLVEFLISPDATYITGQNILVDGGLLGSVQKHIAGRPKSGSL